MFGWREIVENFEKLLCWVVVVVFRLIFTDTSPKLALAWAFYEFVN